MAGMGPWVIYNDFLSNIGKKLVDLVNDIFKVCLVDSTSAAINAAWVGATYAALASDGHEVGNGNGYTTAGAAAGSPTWTGGGATATATFDTANVTWTGSSAGFTARAAVIYSSTSGKLIAYSLLDSAPADVTVSPGNTLEIDIANVFVISKA